MPDRTIRYITVIGWKLGGDIAHGQALRIANKHHCKGFSLEGYSRFGPATAV